MLSKNTSVVAWFIMVRIGRMPRPSAARMSTTNTERPSVRGQKPGLGQRRDEFARIAALAVELAPVFALEAGAERAHRRADLRKVAGFVGVGLSHLIPPVHC